MSWSSIFETCRENNDRFARGCVRSKHAGGCGRGMGGEVQQVLVTQESWDTPCILILASEVEISLKL